MDRKEFLSLIGLSAGAFAIQSCLNGCTKVNQPNVDFTLDVTDPANFQLQTNGGYVYTRGVIVARVSATSYVAVSQTCTHGGSSVVYEIGKNDFFCSTHNAAFASNGQVTGGPATQNLKSYNTSLTGNNLRIWG